MSDNPRKAVCPTCGQDAVKETVWNEGPVTNAVLQCADSHVWMTKWMAAAEWTV